MPVAAGATAPATTSSGRGPANIVAELTTRMRCTDLDTLVSVTVDRLAEPLGFRAQPALLLVDGRVASSSPSPATASPDGASAPRWRWAKNMIGMAAARGRRHAHRQHAPGPSLLAPCASPRADGRGGPRARRWRPGLVDVTSRLAVPGLAMGQLVAVLVAETGAPAVYTPRTRPADRGGVGGRQRGGGVPSAGATRSTRLPLGRGTPPAHRPEGTDALSSPWTAAPSSTTECLIKGVAGRVLWALLGHYGARAVPSSPTRCGSAPSLELPDFATASRAASSC